MGLRKVFTAEDEVWFRKWEEPPWNPDQGGIGTLPPGGAVLPGGEKYRWGFGADSAFRAIYAPDLITPPRIYGEEFHSAYRTVWASPDPARSGQSIIFVFATMRQHAWPSWNVSLWKFDGKTGVCTHRFPAGAGEGGGSSVYDEFTAEPWSGKLWWFGVHASAYHSALVGVNPEDGMMTSDRILESSFELPAGFSIRSIRKAALCQAQRRAYVRWIQSGVRQVHAYDQNSDGTWSLAHDIFAPSEVSQILMTHDGFVYLIDTNDWLTVYDSAGRFGGAMRSPRSTTYPWGSAWGWDRTFRRLLFLGGTANAADGAGTARVEGYYPIVERTKLSPPFPLKPARKGRETKILAHVAGQGGEPLGGGGARLLVGGTEEVYVAVDGFGDAVFPHTPAAAGLDITLEATTPWP